MIDVATHRDSLAALMPGYYVKAAYFDFGTKLGLAAELHGRRAAVRAPVEDPDYKAIAAELRGLLAA